MRYQYKVGSKTIELVRDDDQVAVRFKEPAKHSTRAMITSKCGLGSFHDRTEVPEEKFTLLPVGQVAAPREKRHHMATDALQQETEVARVAPVFKLGDTTILATDRVLLGVKASVTNLAEILAQHQCSLLEQHGEDCVAQLEEEADPFEVAEELTKRAEITYAEPDFVSIRRHLARRPMDGPNPAASDPLAHRQYAINITKAVEAWQMQLGDPNIRIAILDEGVDITHEDLANVVVGAYDGVDNDTYQEPNPWDGHGTACAGLAAAIHANDRGIKGIGGGSSILAARIAYSRREGAPWVTRNSWIARAIDWAWEAGADVISNSWGGGAPSSAITNAFERARQQGRDNKGCVIVVAAGNDSGPVSFPGSLPNVLTVSASNEYDEFKTKTSRDGEHWWGSNFGPEVDLAAPGVHNLTTDISGQDGYASGNYADFNGTSSSTPIVAGAAALLLAANSELSEEEVRDNLKMTADKVGSFPYQNGRNDQFGHGRLNVHAALQLSQPKQASYVTIHKVIQEVPIEDNESSQIAVEVGDSKPLQGIKVDIDIRHTYIGDLRVRLIPPAGSGEPAVLLHDRTGRGQDDLIETYDIHRTPALQQLIGKNLSGSWKLEVTDNANDDKGNILSLALEMSY